MSEQTTIIAGLGNPGDRYSGTRHNVGFMVVDAFAKRYNCAATQDRWEAHSSRVPLFGRKVCLVKPQTYMNLSGKAVVRFVDFYKVPLQSLLVVHDDIDMRLGRIKLVFDGGHGGHKGISSLVQSLGAKDFYRIKIGIGRPGEDGVHPGIPVEDYVLSRFSQEEMTVIDDRISSVLQGIDGFLQGDVEGAMNLLNGLK